MISNSAEKQNGAGNNISRLANELLSPEDIRLTLSILRKHLKSADPYVALQAVKQIFSIAGAYPSKQAPLGGKLEVEVSMKPFAQARVVDATSVKSLTS